MTKGYFCSFNIAVGEKIKLNSVRQTDIRTIKCYFETLLLLQIVVNITVNANRTIDTEHIFVHIDFVIILTHIDFVIIKTQGNIKV